MTDIHGSAVVSPKAEVGEGVSVGPYSIVEAGAVIGDGTKIASNCLIAAGARLGREISVSHGAVIGTDPQDLKFGGEITTARIGDHTVIREHATINRGTAAHGETSIGEHCMLMAYSHVAHDCIIGNHVIMANSVNLAGHIEIGDFAILGGVLPVHQFVKIGAHCMIGGGFRVQQDVVPYSLMGGYPLKVMGANVVGLKRRGFSREALRSIDQAFKLLFYSGLNTTQAVEQIHADVEKTPEVALILDFIAKSERGIIK